MPHIHIFFGLHQRQLAHTTSTGPVKSFGYCINKDVGTLPLAMLGGMEVFSAIRKGFYNTYTAFYNCFCFPVGDCFPTCNRSQLLAVFIEKEEC